MNELIQQVTQRVGISEEQATKAVEVVGGYLKNKLPAPLAGQVDRYLSGDSSQAGGEDQGAMGKIASGIGGAFGGTRKAG
jgi:hypothetical protein